MTLAYISLARTMLCGHYELQERMGNIASYAVALKKIEILLVRNGRMDNR